MNLLALDKIKVRQQIIIIEGNWFAPKTLRCECKWPPCQELRPSSGVSIDQCYPALGHETQRDLRNMWRNTTSRCSERYVRRPKKLLSRQWREIFSVAKSIVSSFAKNLHFAAIQESASPSSCVYTVWCLCGYDLRTIEQLSQFVNKCHGLGHT